LRSAIDRRLAALVPVANHANPLDQAVRYALLAPGKRIRPFLAILAAAELGADELDALDAGCALEMVHAASLILDDLPAMDDAPLRRGQPSTHVAFGQEVAILSSVVLQSRAYATAANAARVEPQTRCKLVTILAGAVGRDGLAGGQYEDLSNDCDTPLARVTDANHLKTGMLFMAAVEMAAAIADVEDDRLERMRSFATHFGQAFQLLDDLKDGHGAVAGEDAGKATILSIVGLEEARRRLERHVAHATELLNPGGALVRFIESLFAGYLAGPVLAEGATVSGTMPRRRSA
jgi:geranylgeranyl diphosphate synthase type II